MIYYVRLYILYLLFNRLLVKSNSNIAFYLQFQIKKPRSCICPKNKAKQYLNNIIKFYKYAKNLLPIT